MNTKSLTIVAVVVIAVVAVAGVALYMGGDNSNDNKVEYNYDFEIKDYEFFGEQYRSLHMNLAIKNINHVSIPSEGGLRLDFITVTVTYDEGEFFDDEVMSGVMSPGNDYVTQLYWSVPLDFSIDQIESVEIGWDVREVTVGLVGEVATPTFVYTESLSTDKYA